MKPALVRLAQILLLTLPTALGAQTPAVVLEDGGIEFPDGSVQSSAALTVPAPVRETGQRRCFDSSGVEVICAGTGQDGDLRPGVKWPGTRFTDNSDGTVTDHLSDLVWLKDAGCFGFDVTWDGAFVEVGELNAGVEKGCPEYAAGAFDDWRVPGILELVSLIDYGTSSGLPSGHPFLFTGIGTCTYWSSTSDLNTPTKAWVGVFGPSTTASTVTTTPKSGDFCLWPVRDRT